MWNGKIQVSLLTSNKHLRFICILCCWIKAEEIGKISTEQNHTSSHLSLVSDYWIKVSTFAMFWSKDVELFVYFTLEYNRNIPCLWGKTEGGRGRLLQFLSLVGFQPNSTRYVCDVYIIHYLNRLLRSFFEVRYTKRLFSFV